MFLWCWILHSFWRAIKSLSPIAVRGLVHYIILFIYVKTTAYEYKISRDTADLSKLYPRPSFCLIDHSRCTPLGLQVLISYIWCPTGQRDLIGLLQSHSIPHHRCSPSGFRVAAAIGTEYLAAKAPVNNWGSEHGPLIFKVIWKLIKFFFHGQLC